MFVNNPTSDANRGGTTAPAQPSNGQAPSPLGWKDLATQGSSPSHRTKTSKRRRMLAILSMLLLIALIFASVRVISVASGSNDQLQLQIGNQQQTVIDLRQSL